MKTQVQLIFKYIGMGIIAILLAMCDTGGSDTGGSDIGGGDTGGTGGTNGGPTNYDISTYTFSYETTPQGTATTLSPTWNKAVSNATYEISHDTPAPGFDVKVPTIDESTGTVDIAVNTTEGVYTITATGTGNYTGEKTTTLPITVATAGKAALTTAINAGITAWGNEGDFNYIITSTITDMSYLFQDVNLNDNAGYQLFNGDISKWNTSAVENMSGMFNGASTFNQDISDWNTSAVKNMSYMFESASAFDQDIKTVIDPAKDGNEAGNTVDDRWNTSAVQNMQAMFWKATLFNQDINNWNVGAVEDSKDTFMFTKSGMESLPCWFNSSANSGNGGIHDPRPVDCAVAD